jgi:hypothetical protein
MKKTKTAYKKIILWACIGLLFIAFGARVYYVNAIKYPLAIVEEYRIGEAAPSGDFLITVKDAYMLDKQSVEEYYAEDIKNLGFEFQCVVVEVEIQNISDKEASFSPPDVTIEGLYQYIQLSKAPFIALNDEQAISDTLEPGEQRCLKLAYRLLKKNFEQQHWDTMNPSYFHLLVDYYPYKRMIQL